MHSQSLQYTPPQQMQCKTFLLHTPQEMHEKDKLECGVANWLCVCIPVAFLLFRGFYQTR